MLDRIFAPSTCMNRNPVGPGYLCTRPGGHRGPHAWVGQESTPDAVWPNLLDDYYTRGSRRFSLAVTLTIGTLLLILLIVGMTVSP